MSICDSREPGQPDPARPLEFDPKPDEVIEDTWGQKLAHFAYKDLKGYSVVRPGWKVDAKISAVEYFIYPDKVGTLDDIPRISGKSSPRTAINTG